MSHISQSVHIHCDSAWVHNVILKSIQNVHIHVRRISDNRRALACVLKVTACPLACTGARWEDVYAGGGAGGGGRLRHVPAAVRRGAGQGRRLLGHAPRRRARQQGQRAALQGGQVWWVLLLLRVCVSCRWYDSAYVLHVVVCVTVVSNPVNNFMHTRVLHEHDYEP